MSAQKIEQNVHPLAMHVCQDLMKNYWGPMFARIRDRPEILETLAGFLQKPEELRIYVGRTHLALEYMGPERLASLPGETRLKMMWVDCTQTEEDLMTNLVGFPIQGVLPFELAHWLVEDLVLSTDAGSDKLLELGWNFAGRDAIIGFNCSLPILKAGHFYRMVNASFFDANAAGLVTRRIKWVDFIPLEYDDSNPTVDALRVDVSPYSGLLEHDLFYPYPIPEGYRAKKLDTLNRFVEAFAAAGARETDITRFIAEPDNNFILTMRFGGKGIRHELPCEWQSDERDAIRPDFFLLRPDGAADIIEFKLPVLAGDAVVGRVNREAFSAELNGYIAQTRVYREYFEDPRNRAWFSDRYGFDVRYPRRYLVVGRRHHLAIGDWRSLQADHRDLDLVSYDDLVESLVAQFYL